MVKASLWGKCSHQYTHITLILAVNALHAGNFFMNFCEVECSGLVLDLEIDVSLVRDSPEVLVCRMSIPCKFCDDFW